MMVTSPLAAMALASLYAREKALVETSFNHMTYNALASIDKQLFDEYQNVHSTRSSEEMDTIQKQEECYKALAQACIRRIAYRYLDKYARLLSTPGVMEDALKCHTLPDELQQQLATKYGDGNSSPPATWYAALEQLKDASTTNGVLDKGKLWRLILEHPMTSYVPVQCQQCGHTVPDQYPLQQTDEEVGLKELLPTGDELELRAGWYRGPRKGLVFELTCPQCQHVSKWYRSGHPKVILNPNKWGRLCGDQEDLRLTLAEYLNIPVRLISPLDWDHVWSEYQSTCSMPTSSWEVQDGSARNFARRLDEGIGRWTRVWAIHAKADWCQDVTREYLTYKPDGGRADDCNDEGYKDMNRYNSAVQEAQNDQTGELTQAKTCNGYILARAKLSDNDITEELQQAARDYGEKEWWQLHS